MGSRINIKLSDLLGIPEVRVAFSTEVLPKQDDSEQDMTMPAAQVDFDGYAVGFDVTTYAGVVTLSSDFNLFRYQAENMRLLKALYETSVPFSIAH